MRGGGKKKDGGGGAGSWGEITGALFERSGLLPGELFGMTVRQVGAIFDHMAEKAREEQERETLERLRREMGSAVVRRW